ncbi:MAG: hypothetical protein CMJ78_12200 [Planctomycetaceae bacterium]|nr:hypothetical protein [Planctomycetaceae bacterium]
MTEAQFRKALEPIASLKFTVVLFALAIFIVLVGTLAQTKKDIWEVIDQYFRSGIAWVEFDVFTQFFTSKTISGSFPFPGGWLIGAMMASNLIAAHLLRFKVQAKGQRAIIGWSVIGVGLITTWLVIQSGANDSGVQEATLVSWSVLWESLKFGLGVLWVSVATALLRIEPKRKLERGMLIACVGMLTAVLGYLFYQGDEARLGDSAMRILWQLLKGGIAGGVLLAGCVLLFKKRAGVVLLHGGIGLMMLSELLVGMLAIEAQMPIEEGDTNNYVQDVRELEIAVIDPSFSDEEDQQVVIPEAIVKDKGAKIEHENLPFDIKIVNYIQNTELIDWPLKPRDEGKGVEENIATAGNGLQYVVAPVRPGSGTDTGGMIDQSAAYVEILKKDTDESVGTYLLALVFTMGNVTESVEIDGKTYEVGLRFKRTYKPYSLHLIDIRKEDYVGTSTPRDYSSYVRLVDPTRKTDREVRIWMNNPLRFAGETFYQSNYSKDPRTGKETTTLSVVTNTGWMIPYVSCMIVMVGMLAHFWVILLRFLDRLAKEELMSASLQGPEWMQTASFAMPILVVFLSACYLGNAARVPRPEAAEMDLYEFGKIPIVYQGRVKPIDTLARNSLKIISKRDTFKVEVEQSDGTTKLVKKPAIEWFLDMITDPAKSFEYDVIRIENLDVLETLGLKRRKGFRYSFADFRDKLDKLTEAAEKARAKPDGQREIYDRKIHELERKIGRMDLLLQAFSTPRIRTDSMDNAAQDLRRAFLQQQGLMRREPPLSVPPKVGQTGLSNENVEEWQTYAFAWSMDLAKGLMGNDEENDYIDGMNEILIAYSENEGNKFNQAVSKYLRDVDRGQREMADSYLERAVDEDAKAQEKLDDDNEEGAAGHVALAERNRELAEEAVSTIEDTGFEAYFNHLEPFYHSIALYVLAFIMACFAWLGFSKPLNASAFWLIVFTMSVHTAALIGRMYISGRPPVTNLYSSAVFIGWGCVGFGIVLEALFRQGVGNIVASVSGFAALLISHILSGDGDTFSVLQAVLDTQFWLATHVTCITLGYSTTFFAGLLGVLYVLRGIATTTLTPKIDRLMIRMIYGIVCFSIFFSFVGTVLGGLWADDSWGRFWGWDPKENGALIIVLWNALILHARWDGMVKDRGLAVLAIVGNIVTSWSWFGVNELGVGLHSYGFTEGVMRTLMIVWAAHAVCIAVGCLPKQYWRSFAARDESIV